MDAKYVWTQEMSVGVQELDEQHQHLFQLLNDVVGLTMEHPNAKMEEKLELLDGIMDYDLYHLKYEEERMHEFDCGNPIHLRAHEWYREISKDTSTPQASRSEAWRRKRTTCAEHW